MPFSYKTEKTSRTKDGIFHRLIPKLWSVIAMFSITPSLEINPKKSDGVCWLALAHQGMADMPWESLALGPKAYLRLLKSSSGAVNFPLRLCFHVFMRDLKSFQKSPEKGSSEVNFWAPACENGLPWPFCYQGQADTLIKQNVQSQGVETFKQTRYSIFTV